MAEINLKELRDDIDKIDSEIVRLFEARMDLCGKIAEYKIDSGKPVFDATRENEKLAALKSLAHDSFNSDGVEELFRQIMSISRKLQYRLIDSKNDSQNLPFIMKDSLDLKTARVVFQGAEGAFSQAATIKYFSDRVKSFHVDTFRDAMLAIDEGSADFAVLPIENSTAGSVNEIYDLLDEFENYIVGEQIIKIEHCLMGVPGVKLSDIETVFSHPQSLMQSNKFLSMQPWKQISMANNAYAAKKVADDKDKSQAAIASEYAAKAYGLEILKKGINKQKNNSTRFIIVSNQKIFTRDADKISIRVEVKDESGSLYKMLSHFMYNNLNLSRIESRPIEGRNWEYRFFVDFEGNLADTNVKNCLRSLRHEVASMKILGNYVRSDSV